MTAPDLHPWLSFDVESTQGVVERFLSSYVDRAGKDGYVLGLSGGLDSATAAVLAVDAVGADRIHAFSMPGPTSTDEDETLARSLADTLEVDLERVPIGPPFEALADRLPEQATSEVQGNVQARLRMTLLYAHAQATNRLVLGTGNKSELLTGYFTKHGDGGVDVLPLGDLYKTQVRHLAAHTGIPEGILERPPTAGLWEGQTDEGELGITYDTLDVVLSGIEQQHPPARIAHEASVEEPEVERIERLVATTQHKRNPPPIPKLGWRTVGVDWREPTAP